MKNMIPEKLIPYLSLLPLTVFLIYARIFGFTLQAWQGAFIIAGIMAVCITILLLSQPIILDRLMLGVNLFFFVGALAFIFNIIPILQFYSAYKGPAFFMNIVIVGLITTFFSSAGFIGVYHQNRFALNKASCALLATSIACLGISFLLNNYGLLISTACPFIGLRAMRDVLVRQLKL